MDAQHDPIAIVRPAIVAQVTWIGYAAGVYNGRWWPAGLYRELPGGRWELQGFGVYRGEPLQ